MKTQLQKVLGAAALSVVALLGSVGSAQAAIVRGSFDPAFGAPFITEGSLLGWRGTVDFYVPSACSSVVGTIADSNTCNDADPMRILAASVELYDVDHPVLTKATLNLSPTTLFPFALKNVFFTDGAIAGIETDYSAPVKPLEEQTFAGINDYYFALGFGANGLPRLVALRENLGVFGSFDTDDFVGFTAWLSEVSESAGVAVVDALYDGVIELAASPNGGNGGSKVSVNIDSYKFSEVPEPETLFLMLCALAALGATTRRSSKTTA